MTESRGAAPEPAHPTLASPAPATTTTYPYNPAQASAAGPNMTPGFEAPPPGYPAAEQQTPYYPPPQLQQQYASPYQQQPAPYTDPYGKPYDPYSQPYANYPGSQPPPGMDVEQAQYPGQQGVQQGCSVVGWSLFVFGWFFFPFWFAGAMLPLITKKPQDRMPAMACCGGLVAYCILLAILIPMAWVNSS